MRPSLMGLNARIPVLISRWLGLLTMGLFLLVACETYPAGTKVQQITWQEAQVLLKHPPKGLTVLDVRTPKEFDDGHIPGAINVNYKSGFFEEKLLRHDRHKPYLIYCREERRSKATLSLMIEKGFKHIYRLKGGITKWQAQGLGVISSANPK